MQPANKALNQHTPAPWRAAPASSASTTTSGSAPNSRGVVSHGRKNWDKDFIAKTNTPATTTPPKQPPATPAPQSNLPATTPAPWCVAPAWSTAMVKAGSSSNRRGCFYSAKNILGFVAEMYHASYDSIAKTTSRSVTQPVPRRRAELTAIAIVRYPVSNLPHQPPHQRRPVSG